MLFITLRIPVEIKGPRLYKMSATVSSLQRARDKPCTIHDWRVGARVQIFQNFRKSEFVTMSVIKAMRGANVNSKTMRSRRPLLLLTFLLVMNIALCNSTKFILSCRRINNLVHLLFACHPEIKEIRKSLFD